MWLPASLRSGCCFPSLVLIMMRVKRRWSTEPLSQASRRIALFEALVILSGALITSADAQTHNVDGTFLVEARINGTRGAGSRHRRRALSSRSEFAQRFGLPQLKVPSRTGSPEIDVP